MGIARRGVDQFLVDLSQEVRWDILLLQEFSAVHEIDYCSEPTVDGHIILLQPPGQGRRRSAIIIHARHSHRLVEGSFKSSGRASVADFLWEGWKLRLLNGHLDAEHNLQKYKSLSQILDIICFQLLQATTQ